MARSSLFYKNQKGYGAFSTVEDMARSTGDRFYVDSGKSSTGADTAGFGQSPDVPFLTIGFAIGQCAPSNGDIIYVMPGHAETVTTAITLNVIGVSIIGLGEGTARPQISSATASIDELTIMAANCLVENLLFNEATDATDSMINVAAADCTIRGCHFDLGTNEAEAVTITADGDDLLLEGNTFNVTANGPQRAIEIEAAGTTRTTIKDNTFYCSDGANFFDTAAINSGVANTGLVVTGNTFNGMGVTGAAVVAATAVGKAIFSNKYVGGVVNIDSDQFAGDVHITADPAPLVVDDSVWYVDSVDGLASNDGHTPQSALVTLTAAEALASAGDTIILASGHVETPVAVTTLNLAGLNIIGSGTGTRRPQFTINAAVDALDVQAANITISNIYFNEGTSANTSRINVGAAHCTIRNCQFDCGVNDLESITVEAAADYLTIKDCVWDITADGPVAAIEIEGASDDLWIEGCRFNGGSAANAWDAAAINSTAVHLAVTIKDCEFRWVKTAQEYITSDAAVEPLNVQGCTFWDGAALASQLNGPRTFHVSSGSGNDVTGAGQSIHQPCATIDYAVGLCSPNAGDLILVYPGHAEVVSGAGDLDLDIAGITIRGIGNGSDTPTVTLDTADTADVDVDAVNITVENIHFVANFIDILAAIDVNAADFTLRNCRFTDNGTSLNAIIWIKDAAVDRMTIEDCRCNALGTNNTHFIDLSSTGDSHIIRNNVLMGDWATACIGGSGAVTQILVDNNRIFNAAAGADLCIPLASSGSGLISYNATTAGHASQGIIPGNCGSIENYYEQNTSALSGLLEPADV